ncbi:MAG TPA: ABC transporter permease [Aliidongia sp.]|nr:ABC transporter permease [Aliidongia sp.]
MVALAAIAVLIAVCAGAPLLGLQDPAVQVLTMRVAPPSGDHWLGTDELGRDMLARLVYGGRATLGLTTTILLLVAPTGLLIGAFAGFTGGVIDQVLMRVTDVFLAFPRLVLALAFVAALKPGIGGAIGATALTSWPLYARLARAETLKIRHSDFIAAIRLTGAGSVRIVLHHIVPLCLPSIIVRAALDGGGVMLTIATLGFLGMGVQPPVPEWGAMIATSRDLILQQWWVPVFPGSLVFLTVLSFTVIGDVLRDALDPKWAGRC